MPERYEVNQEIKLKNLILKEFKPIEKKKIKEYIKENEKEILEDMETVALGLKLLSYDYIGGHGSRGYGRVTIDNINVDCVVGDINKEILDKCNELLKRK